MVKVTVYNVPDDVAASFKRLADSQHRSMTAQLLHIMEQAVREFEKTNPPPPFGEEM